MTFHVTLLALVNQWRFQSEHVTAADVFSESAIEERAQVLRECAYELEKLLRSGSSGDRAPLS